MDPDECLYKLPHLPLAPRSGFSSDWRKEGAIGQREGDNCNDPCINTLVFLSSRLFWKNYCCYREVFFFNAFHNWDGPCPIL